MSHTKIHGVSILAVAAVALGVASGAQVARADESARPCAPSQEQAQAAQPPARAAARPSAGLLEESLRTLSLRADQRARIAAVAASIAPSREATRAARAALLAALAAQVERGDVDPQALRAKIDAAVNAEASERATERAALEQLHGILDAGQRAAMADTMESRLAAWEPRETRAGELRRITAELRLTRAQRAAVAALLRGAPIPHDLPPRAAKSIERRIAEAFRSEDFVMEHVVHDDTRATAAARLARFVGLAARIAHLLAPEQRHIAAGKLRARAPHGMLGL
jgi:hypothetical protein